MTPKRNWKLNKKGIRNTRTFVMRPSKDAVHKIKRKINETFDPKYSMNNIVKIMNPIIRGWTNYYRISYHSQRTFQHITSYILMKFYKWGRRKHSTKGYKWLRKRYVIGTPTRKWAIGNSKEELMLIPNEAHHWELRTIKVELNPYTDSEYFIKKNIHLTAEKLRKTVYIKNGFKCGVCGGPLAGEESIELHHIKAIKDGGKTTIKNLVPVHTTCHKGITYAGIKLIKDR